MAKPWAKYEVDFINHDKFRAISAPAICLWLEGKNYADKKLTDGLLPLHAVKLFRFYSVKNVTMLTGSIGPKSAGDDAELYAALWELVPSVGWKMHDYLDHNECRDDAIQRIFEAQVAATAEKQKHAAKMQRWRDAKAAKAERDAAVTGGVTASSRHKNGHIAECDALDQKTEDRKQKEPERPPSPNARSRHPVFRGRFVVFDWMLEDLEALLGPHAEGFGFDVWFDTLNRRCLADGTVPPDRDGGAWLKAQTLAEAQRRGLPLVAVSATSEADEWAAIIAKGPSVRP